MDSFWAALQFLTIFPTPLKGNTNEKIIGTSLVYFPLVGLLLGVLLFGLYYVLALVLPASVVCALLVIALAILTGGQHIDGLMDSCDGILGGKDREERLTIMSDTKVGAFGIIGAILLLGTKYIAILSVPALPALLLMPTLGRWAMTYAIFSFPYARVSGLGLSFKLGVSWQKFTVASFLALALSALLMTWKGAVLLGALCAVTYGTGRFIQSRIGGLTGDSYGAINEIAEVTTLLLIIMIDKLPWR